MLCKYEPIYCLPNHIVSIVDTLQSLFLSDFYDKPILKFLADKNISRLIHVNQWKLNRFIDLQ